MRTVALALLFSSSVCAQPLPDGEALLKNQAAALNRFHSIQYIDRSTTEISTPKGPVKVVSETFTAMVNPGKSRTESNNQGLTFLAVSNGQVTTIYSSPPKEYVKVPAALGPEGIMRSIGATMPDFSNVLTAAKTWRDETIEIDGAPHDCCVVESQPGNLKLPVVQNLPVPQTKITEARFTFWIDKKLNLPLQVDVASKMQIGFQPPFSGHATTVKRDLNGTPVPLSGDSDILT